MMQTKNKLTVDIGKTTPSKSENSKSLVTQIIGEEMLIDRLSLAPVPGLEPCSVTPATEPPSSDKSNVRSHTTPIPSLGGETPVVTPPSKKGKTI